MLTRRILIALSAASLAAAAHAQSPPPPAPAPEGPPSAVSTNPKVVLTTAQGDITIELFVDKAPITAKNYLKYVDRKLYDGATFYRASKPPGQAANDYGTVQGGLQNDPKKVLPPIAHESTLKTGILHKDGVISMGRRAPGTAQADWFICVGDMPYLDADPKDPKNPGFAAFGHVVSGMDVVQKILGLPTDPNRGEGAMKGEMLVKPVKIVSIRRVAG
jgi:peptidyl-prolyl cis-trans isomerase A (cyclophilin A)